MSTKENEDIVSRAQATRKMWLDDLTEYRRQAPALQSVGLNDLPIEQAVQNVRNADFEARLRVIEEALGVTRE